LRLPRLAPIRDHKIPSPLRHGACRRLYAELADIFYLVPVRATLGTVMVGEKPDKLRLSESSASFEARRGLDLFASGRSPILANLSARVSLHSVPLGQKEREKKRKKEKKRKRKRKGRRYLARIASRVLRRRFSSASERRSSPLPTPPDIF